MRQLLQIIKDLRKDTKPHTAANNMYVDKYKNITQANGYTNSKNR